MDTLQKITHLAAIVTAWLTVLAVFNITVGYPSRKVVSHAVSITLWVVTVFASVATVNLISRSIALWNIV